jgi:ribonuclease HII
MKGLLLGVDEAGRGPLAGPVAVGAVIVPAFFDIREQFPGIADSKVLSEKKREELFEMTERMQTEGILRYIVVFASAQTIDNDGITKAVRDAVYKGIQTLAPEAEGVRVLLDGLLHAPPEYVQETIVRGDATEPVISLASIAAKVSRDRLMKTMGEKFPHYGFEKHKGYGTKAHKEAIAAHGLCEEHRKTFCHL